MGEAVHKHCQGAIHKQPWRERERKRQRGEENWFIITSPLLISYGAEDVCEFECRKGRQWASEQDI